jgi:ABC-2 type transport system ATP-binding protein
MSEAIETNGLGKHFGELKAVSELSLSVRHGEIYAFLGLNGAGKSTTIRMLLGMAAPSAGEAHVLGSPVRHRSVRGGIRASRPWDRVGYLVETPHAYPQLTVEENLEAVRRLRPGIERAAVQRVMRDLALEAYAHRPAGRLSLGNAQRLGLAKALMHEPELLILDEPANALDPAGIVEVRQLFIDLAARRGVTVFISSHILGEVSRLADRIGIIHEGKLIQELDAAELAQKRLRRLVLRTRDAEAARRVLARAGLRPEPATGNGPRAHAQDHGRHPTASDTSQNHSQALALRDRNAIERPERIARILVEAGQDPSLLVVEEEDLEHYFLRLIGAESEQPKWDRSGRQHA